MRRIMVVEPPKENIRGSLCRKLFVPVRHSRPTARRPVIEWGSRERGPITPVIRHQLTCHYSVIKLCLFTKAAFLEMAAWARGSSRGRYQRLRLREPNKRKGRRRNVGAEARCEGASERRASGGLSVTLNYVDSPGSSPQTGFRPHASVWAHRYLSAVDIRALLRSKGSCLRPRSHFLSLTSHYLVGNTLLTPVQKALALPRDTPI
ncbi:hypothetical protein BC826DRAFT_158829 [Russula brevipes]|nr:hypothetical protein BC826DRAFT_158829 [Russula brevipes]